MYGFLGSVWLALAKPAIQRLSAEWDCGCHSLVIIDVKNMKRIRSLPFSYSLQNISESSLE